MAENEALTINENGKKSPALISAVYLYLALPILIFFIGWLKLWLAIPAVLILLAALYFALRSAPAIYMPEFNKNNLLTILVILVTAFIWLYFSGIGGMAYQNSDFLWRNAVFKMLVEEKWPVVIENAAPYFDSPVALIYYFAFWLPAALFGKVFGMSAGIAFQFVWAYIGIILTIYLLIAARKKLSVWPAFVFIFFSGLDVLGQFILINSSTFTWFNSSHIENWASGFQYSSFTTQLFWVFNQAIPAWLITLALYHQKDNRSIVFLYSFALLSCTLPAIGLLPFVVFFAISNIIRNYNCEKRFRENFFGIIKNLFTFTNVAGGGFVGIISFLFLRTNSSGQKAGFTDMKTYMASYLLFIFFEFLIYFILIYRAKPHTGLYYTTLISLLLIPLFKVGTSIDFVMRASIPALLLLCLMVIKAFDHYHIGKKRLLLSTLLLAVVIGGITAQHEIIRSLQITLAAHGDSSKYLTEPVDLITDGHRGNFFGTTDNSFFFEYMAKK